MMSKKLKPTKIGIIGAGFIGQLAHIVNYADLENCQIVALAAGRAELRQKVARRYAIPRSYASHHELLADDDVEAVVAVTSRQGIGPVALDCLKAGKPLLTEKPMASTVDQARQLIQAAEQRRVIYTVGYVKRYDAGVARAKALLDEILQSGELGPVLYSRIHCFGSDAYYPHDQPISTQEPKSQDWATWPIAPEWVPPEQREEYHDYLNAYCHGLNLIRYLMGRTPGVSHVDFSKPGAKTVILDFGDHTSLLETGKYSYRGWDEYIEIYFAEGLLRIKLPPTLLRNVSAEVELYKGREEHRFNRFYEPWSWAFRRQAENFIASVRGEVDTLSSGDDALEDIRLAEAIWKYHLEKADCPVSS